jgi:hypothetical protein
MAGVTNDMFGGLWDDSIAPVAKKATPVVAVKTTPVALPPRPVAVPVVVEVAQTAPVIVAEPTHKDAVGKRLLDIESRFLEAAELTGINIGHFPLEQQEGLQVTTDKDKSDEHGEVFTPLWLVDTMLDRVDNETWKDQRLTTEDLCSGRGQFTIRMLRKKYSVLGAKFNIEKFLTRTHLYIEIQPRSCFHLMHIFGTDIRLLIGDAAKKGKLPPEAEKGIWVWSDACQEWHDCTGRVTRLFNKFDRRSGGAYHSGKSVGFEAEFKQDQEDLEQKVLTRRKKHGSKKN